MTSHVSQTPVDTLYGVLGQYDGPDELVQATRQVREAGYRRFDAYTPMPVEGLAEAMQFRPTRVPIVVLIGGLFGALVGYGLQYWVSVAAYPLNVGGRPLHSWPAFIPVTFELTILCAALSGILGMLALNGLPRPHHPLFGVPQFEHATRDGFFLCIEARDPMFSPETAREILMNTGAHEVIDVPR